MGEGVSIDVGEFLLIMLHILVFPFFHHALYRSCWLALILSEDCT